LLRLLFIRLGSLPTGSGGTRDGLLQSFEVEESRTAFFANTLLFFAETLADLEKEVAKGRTPDGDRSN
jgi:hypothetical protein